MNLQTNLGIAYFISSLSFIVLFFSILLFGLHRNIAVLHEKRHIWMINLLLKQRVEKYPSVTLIGTPTYKINRVPGYKMFKLYKGHTDSSYLAYLSQHKTDKTCLRDISLIAFMGTPFSNVLCGSVAAVTLAVTVVGVCNLWSIVPLALSSILLGATLTLFVLSLFEITKSQNNDWHHLIKPDKYEYPKR